MQSISELVDASTTPTENELPLSKAVLAIRVSEDRYDYSNRYTIYDLYSTHLYSYIEGYRTFVLSLLVSKSRIAYSYIKLVGYRPLSVISSAISSISSAASRELSNILQTTLNYYS